MSVALSATNQETLGEERLGVGGGERLGSPASALGLRSVQAPRSRVEARHEGQARAGAELGSLGGSSCRFLTQRRHRNSRGMWEPVSVGLKAVKIDSCLIKVMKKYLVGIEMILSRQSNNIIVGIVWGR